MGYHTQEGWRIYDGYMNGTYLLGLRSLASLTSLTHALTMLTAQLCGSERFEQLEEIIQEADYYEY